MWLNFSNFDWISHYRRQFYFSLDCPLHCHCWDTFLMADQISNRLHHAPIPKCFLYVRRSSICSNRRIRWSALFASAATALVFFVISSVVRHFHSYLPTQKWKQTEVKHEKNKRGGESIARTGRWLYWYTNVQLVYSIQCDSLQRLSLHIGQFL